MRKRIHIHTHTHIYTCASFNLYDSTSLFEDCVYSEIVFFYERLCLFWAARHGHIELLNCLITNGANVNDKDNNGRTPLWIAKQYNLTSVVKVLQEAGGK
eukprot:GHVR01192667.1.p1 GENE.GHVR01192667.1~~GHVR01192667.1.p1  ORF type:complete len:107 (+),score=14.57 GHVR01192667.1:23-322(+)